ncbi:MAG: hypothetical protein KC416_13520, partial [Myxococcales bacterium]|nr:hypothetical protein [Myxococcales bacterium]
MGGSAVGYAAIAGLTHGVSRLSDDPFDPSIGLIFFGGAPPLIAAGIFLAGEILDGSSNYYLTLGGAATGMAFALAAAGIFVEGDAPDGYVDAAFIVLPPLLGI